MTASVARSPKYQLLDPLTEQQYADLREDIAESGILQPIAVDEFGTVIDGHHRQRIADELGIDYPTHQPLPTGATEAAKLDAAVKLNLMGRHQTAEQKRETIKRYLLRRPEAADRYVARLIGCGHQLVARVRVELEASGLIIQEAERVTERAGKPYAQKVRAKPDPEAVAKRQADLKNKRAKAAPKQAAERAEAEALTSANMAPGGAMQGKRQARVVATQDRIKAALTECVVALTRALQDPGLDEDLIRAELDLPNDDFRIVGTTKRLRGLTSELDARLNELKRAAKTSRIERDSADRQ
jgi:ParB-like chromosome segregation protein Spo0J